MFTATSPPIVGGAASSAVLAHHPHQHPHHHQSHHHHSQTGNQNSVQIPHLIAAAAAAAAASQHPSLHPADQQTGSVLANGSWQPTHYITTATLPPEVAQFAKQQLNSSDYHSQHPLPYHPHHLNYAQPPISMVVTTSGGGLTNATGQKSDHISHHTQSHNAHLANGKHSLSDVNGKSVGITKQTQQPNNLGVNGNTPANAICNSSSTSGNSTSPSTNINNNNAQSTASSALSSPLSSLSSSGASSMSPAAMSSPAVSGQVYANGSVASSANSASGSSVSSSSANSINSSGAASGQSSDLIAASGIPTAALVNGGLVVINGNGNLSGSLIGTTGGGSHHYHQSLKDTTFTKIFVGGLPYHTTDKSLRTFFETYGDIEEAVVITDRQTGKSRGYGFVSFQSLSFFLSS